MFNHEPRKPFREWTPGQVIGTALMVSFVIAVVITALIMMTSSPSQPRRATAPQPTATTVAPPQFGGILGPAVSDRDDPSVLNDTQFYSGSSLAPATTSTTVSNR